VLPRGDVAPLENFVGKNIKGGPREKSTEVYPSPPLENFVEKKSQR
jgi:hypothetical protein